MKGITYDTGALIAAERRHRGMAALHRTALERGLRPTVPAGVLGQAWRGGPQAEVSRLLLGCKVEPLDEEAARRAGALCSAAGASDLIDASVVAGAADRGDSIVTSDPSDITRLIAATGKRIRFEVV